jgi:hypothetical protein
MLPTLQLGTLIISSTTPTSVCRQGCLHHSGSLQQAAHPSKSLASSDSSSKQSTSRTVGHAVLWWLQQLQELLSWLGACAGAGAAAGAGVRQV